MVEQAAIEDLFHSEYFFWVDAGAWRYGHEDMRSRFMCLQAEAKAPLFYPYQPKEWGHSQIGPTAAK
jgi:hypothetical protein